jgi:broad specificity phosphatase PhoE
MLSVYLLRHGETAYNADGNRYCGRTDIELTEKGLAQARGVFERLKGVKIDVAEIASGTTDVATDGRIIEVDFGQWEHKTKEEFIEEDPSSWKGWMDEPETSRAGRTGETGKEIVHRVDAFFNEMLLKHTGETIVVVGHNGINRLYMAYKLGMPLKNYRRIFQENSAITFFELDNNGEITLKKLNA